MSSTDEIDMLHIAGVLCIMFFIVNNKALGLSLLWFVNITSAWCDNLHIYCWSDHALSLFTARVIDR